MTADKCCGSCRHRSKWRVNHAVCMAPLYIDASRLPSCIEVVPSLKGFLESKRHLVTPHGGKNCPVYEPRQNDSRDTASSRSL